MLLAIVEDELTTHRIFPRIYDSNNISSFVRLGATEPNTGAQATSQTHHHARGARDALIQCGGVIFVPHWALLRALRLYKTSFHNVPRHTDGGGAGCKDSWPGGVTRRPPAASRALAHACAYDAVSDTGACQFAAPADRQRA